MWLVLGAWSHVLFLLLTVAQSCPTPEKAMAPHSSTLAWKIPWTEEPGRLQSMGLLGVRYDWATSLSLFTLMHWRRKCQPTPVFLPGESRDGGVWWAAIYGVAQSWTWLKWLSSSSMSDSLSPHGQQKARLPCPSLSPKACSDSCPLSWWCHSTISSSVTPFSSCPQSFPASCESCSLGKGAKGIWHSLPSAEKLGLYVKPSFWGRQK